jgi:hypothetical protein
VTARKNASAKRTRGQKRIGEWTATQFSLANPEGRGQGRLPRLLNRLADETEILDITFHAEVTDEGDRPHFTVYYYRAGTKNGGSKSE